MDIAVFLSIGSLLVAALLAIIQLRKHLAERTQSRHKDAAIVVKAGAERESIIISGAEKAVSLLERSLTQAYLDYEKRGQTIDLLTAKITVLELTIEDLKRRLHAVEERGGT